ncbi:sensor histidine kinase [Sediminibacillus albus]|uniref:Sensor histidine kinase YesM n=1 Tax=Sediminibacillus albus TaxID=407036 RepID=A0A1G8Y2L4_9BACI|nr:sensor histidine kinase [Sediminibacillus albus]SDJ97062.1 Sensor histidine kinase YesM [Sediminibacillus albus]
MNKLLRAIQTNSLFVKMFLVMVISIISVTVLITFSTIRMSNNLFMETFSITNTKVLNQIKQQFESYSYSVVYTTINVQNNGTIKRLLTKENVSSLEASNSFYTIKEQMDRMFSHNPSDANMIVLGKNNQLFNMKYINWSVSADALIDHPITKNSNQHPNEILYQFVSEGDFTNGRPMIVATKALTERSTENVYGYLYIPIRERDLREFYEGYTSEGNSVLVMNGRGEIISSNQQELIGQTSQKLLAAAKETEENGIEYKDVHVLDKDYLLLTSALPALDMYLVNLVDQELVIDNLVDRREIVLISIAIVLLAVGIVFIISRRMTTSLRRLVKQISNMAKYDFNKPVAASGGYEARKLANAFNYMLNELQEHVDNLIKAQRKQRKSELEALQHQINPHFLYNTLTSVKFLVKENKKAEALETIDALIPLLQNALGNVDETITVEQEVTNIKNYVQINQTRYGDRIKVNTLISPDCLHYHLPKLVIQPFIENAFFHAFTEKKQGFIQILIAERDDRLVCEVVDTGDGMQVNKMQGNKGKRQLFSGIGVRNVHERIQLLFGKEYGIEVSSELNKGTKVKIILPIIDENDKNNTISKDNTKTRFLGGENF